MVGYTKKEMREFSEFFVQLRGVERNRALENIKSALRISDVRPKQLEKIDINILTEATLIKATRVVYRKEIKADIVLMSLGLLKDFDYRKEVENRSANDNRKILTKYRKKFINESTYLEKLYGGQHKTRSRDEIRSDEKLIKDVIKTLEKTEKRFIDKVAQELFERFDDIIPELIKEEKDYFQKIGAFKYELRQPSLINRVENMHERDKNAIRKIDEKLSSNVNSDDNLLKGSMLNAPLIKDATVMSGIRTYRHAELEKMFIYYRDLIMKQLAIEQPSRPLQRENDCIEITTGIPHTASLPLDPFGRMESDNWKDLVDNIIDDNPDITQYVEAENEKKYTLRFYIKKKQYDCFYDVPTPIHLKIAIQSNPGDSNIVLVRLLYPIIPQDAHSPLYELEEGYIYFQSSQAFHIDLINGSGFIEDNEINEIGKFPLNNSIFNGSIFFKDPIDDNGSAFVASKQLDYILFPTPLWCGLPSSYQYGCYVSLQIKTVFDVSYNIAMGVQVAYGNWSNCTDVKNDDEVGFIFLYINTDKLLHSNVLIHVDLPGCFLYKHGSTTLYSSSYDATISVARDTIISSDGLDIGSYAPGEGAIIHITTKVIKPRYDDCTHKFINTNTYICRMHSCVDKTFQERQVWVNLVD